MTDYSGTWICNYYFPSNTHDGEDVSAYTATIQQTGNELIVQSLPNDTGSYLLLRLIIDDIYAAGSWTENTAPDGEFAGMIYSGVVQLILSEDGTSMRGLWAGVGRDLNEQKPDVYNGRWELIKQ